MLGSKEVDSAGQLYWAIMCFTILYEKTLIRNTSLIQEDTIKIWLEWKHSSDKFQEREISVNISAQR